MALGLSGRLSWLDAEGKPRLARVRTRDVSTFGAFVECLSGADAISLYRLVELRLDQPARTCTGIPDTLGQERVAGAVYRVGALDAETGLPEGYALRLLVSPDRRRPGSGGEPPEALVACPRRTSAGLWSAARVREGATREQIEHL